MAGDEHPVREHERRFDELKENHKDHEKRIRALEEAAVKRDEQIKQIFIAVGEIKQLVASALKDMKEDTKKTSDEMKAIIKPLSDDIEVLKEKPRKKWEDFQGIVLAAIVTGVIGLLIGLFFGGKGP